MRANEGRKAVCCPKEEFPSHKTKKICQLNLKRINSPGRLFLTSQLSWTFLGKYHWLPESPKMGHGYFFNRSGWAHCETWNGSAQRLWFMCWRCKPGALRDHRPSDLHRPAPECHCCYSTGSSRVTQSSVMDSCRLGWISTCLNMSYYSINDITPFCTLCWTG